MIIRISKILISKEIVFVINRRFKFEDTFQVIGELYINFNPDVSLNEFKSDYLNKITRKKIIITSHGKIRVRGRQNFTDEEIKDIILEKIPISITRNKNEFELKYNYHKRNNTIIIIVVIHDPIKKSIRLVTTYNE